jgi:hypothetical protein
MPHYALDATQFVLAQANGQRDGFGQINNEYVYYKL